jgi:hypothetical protein
LLAGAAGLHWQQQLEVLQDQERGLKAQLQRLEDSGRQRQALVRSRQAAQAQLERLRLVQAQRLQLLEVLEDLGRSAGPRLSLVRLDEQGLVLHGQARATELQAWSQARTGALAGFQPPELMELVALAEPGVPAGSVRFVLRWSHQERRALP